MITIREVAHLSTYIHVRITENEHERWKQAAALRGQTLSELVRTAIEAELVTPAITARAGVSGSSLLPQASSRARTLEEKIQATLELVDGLGSGR